MVDCHISYIRKWGKKRKKEKKTRLHMLLCNVSLFYKKQFEKKLGKCIVKYFFPTEFHHLCSIRNSKGKLTLLEKKTLTPIDEIGKVGPTMGPPFLSIKK
jgi:hypothetical protein